MNKQKLIIFIIFSLLFLNSCTFSYTKEKPNKYYYTNCIINNLSSSHIIKCNVIESNFKRNIQMKKDDIQTVKEFFYSLKTNNFLTNVKDIDLEPQYKVFLKFDKKEYIINVYNDKFVSIYPWDGIYDMDYIDTSYIQNSKSIYYLCKFLNEEIN